MDENRVNYQASKLAMLVDMAPEKSSVYNLALFRYSSEDKRDLY
jgi:hypothetical protein